MTLVKNNPVYLGNLVDELFHQFPAAWGKDSHHQYAYPPANINETTDAYHVAISAPGRNKEDFSIQVDNNLLTISFEKKAEAEQANYKTIRKEFSFRSFKRSCFVQLVLVDSPGFYSGNFFLPVIINSLQLQMSLWVTRNISCR